MKLLVTGASGFTGKHFVKAAKAQGYDVVSLQSSLENLADLKQEIAHVAPEVVVHLAAISFVGHEDACQFYNVNVIGTINLLDALTLLKQPPRVLLASSANVYGNSKNSPITEDSPLSPINHYAMSKMAMEYMARTYLDRLPLFFVRPFNYIGPGQSESFIIPKLIAHYLRRADTIELGNCDVAREFNDVRFVCEVYCRLLKQGEPGEVYNICSGKPVALKLVIELLSKLTNHSMTVKVNPAFVRQNEIYHLCGCPEKLMATIGDIDKIPIENTFQWMLGYTEGSKF